MTHKRSILIAVGAILLASCSASTTSNNSGNSPSQAKFLADVREDDPRYANFLADVRENSPLAHPASYTALYPASFNARKIEAAESVCDALDVGVSVAKVMKEIGEEADGDPDMKLMFDVVAMYGIKHLCPQHITKLKNWLDR